MIIKDEHVLKIVCDSMSCNKCAQFTAGSRYAAIEAARKKGWRIEQERGSDTYTRCPSCEHSMQPATRVTKGKP